MADAVSSPAAGPVGAPGWLAEVKQRYELATDFTLSWDRWPDRRRAITKLAYEDLPRALAALEAVLAAADRSECASREMGEPAPGWVQVIRGEIASAPRDAQGGGGQ